MGLVFCFLGIFFIIPVFGPFGVIWTLFAGVMAGVSAVNLFSRKGIYSQEIVVEDDREPHAPPNFQTTPSDVEARLNTLRQLYDRRAITKEEYDEKRREILDEL